MAIDTSFMNEVELSERVASNLIDLHRLASDRRVLPMSMAQAISDYWPKELRTPEFQIALNTAIIETFRREIQDDIGELRGERSNPDRSISDRIPAHISGLQNAAESLGLNISGLLELYHQNMELSVTTSNLQRAANLQQQIGETSDPQEIMALADRIKEHMEVAKYAEEPIGNVATLIADTQTQQNAINEQILAQWQGITLPKITMAGVAESLPSDRISAIALYSALGKFSDVPELLTNEIRSAAVAQTTRLFDENRAALARGAEQGRISEIDNHFTACEQLVHAAQTAGLTDVAAAQDIDAARWAACVGYETGTRNSLASVNPSEHVGHNHALLCSIIPNRITRAVELGMPEERAQNLRAALQTACVEEIRKDFELVNSGHHHQLHDFLIANKIPDCISTAATCGLPEETVQRLRADLQATAQAHGLSDEQHGHHHKLFAEVRHLLEQVVHLPEMAIRTFGGRTTNHQQQSENEVSHR